MNDGDVIPEDPILEELNEHRDCAALLDFDLRSNAEAMESYAYDPRLALAVQRACWRAFTSYRLALMLVGDAIMHLSEGIVAQREDRGPA